MQCQKTIIEEGATKVVDKIRYLTMVSAIKNAAIMTAHDKSRLVFNAYKCGECLKYHVGRTPIRLSIREQKKLKREYKLIKDLGVKIVGKIDLNKQSTK